MKGCGIAVAILVSVLQCGAENRDVNNICLGAPNLSYVASLISCSYYYACIDGVAYGYSCEEGKWFSTELQSCVHPEDSDCDIEQPPELPTPPPPTPSPMCDDVPDFSYLPSTESCQIYYQCIDGFAYRLSCPAYYWFNVTAQRCGNRYEFDCDLDTTTSVPPTTPANRCAFEPNFGLVENPSFCDRFFFCMSGMEFPMICWNELVFDYEKQTCVSPDQSDCDVTEPTPSPEPEPNLCENVDDGQSVLDSRYCNQYLTCQNEIGVSAVCTDGLWFDQDQQECVHPIDAYCPHGGNSASPTPDVCIGIEDGAFVASPYDCDSYYVCANEVAYRLFCPPKQHFDADRNMCDDSSLVVCPL
ncbi:peritrophin-48-like [Wyeomyia smithii]|uniref:peritrophin-48-like n=1 Tax=Wyeomyia smithii TaxID=174621 RepID=UPI002467BF17|nr:peritrophin-48-like [Wyeomyia smithii]